MNVLVIKLSLKHSGERKYGVLNTLLIVIWVSWCLPVQPGWRAIAMWTHCKNHFWVWDKLWRTSYYSCLFLTWNCISIQQYRLHTWTKNYLKISLLANIYFPLSFLCSYVSFLLSLNFIRLRIISLHLSVYLCQIGVVRCNFDIEMLVESTSVGRMKRWE